jgi:hypothetical protein
MTTPYPEGLVCPDRYLLKLLGAIALLNVLHLVDHVLCGDSH